MSKEGEAGADSWVNIQNGGARAKAWAWMGNSRATAKHGIYFIAPRDGEAVMELELYDGGVSSFGLATVSVGFFSRINGEHQEVALGATFPELSIDIESFLVELLEYTVDYLEFKLMLEREDFHALTWKRTFDTKEGSIYVIDFGLFADAIGAFAGYAEGLIVGQFWRVKIYYPS